MADKGKGAKGSAKGYGSKPATKTVGKKANPFAAMKAKKGK